MNLNKRRKAEEMMVDLMYEMSNQLLQRIESGVASSQDFSNAIKLLQNNDITIAVNKGEPLDILSTVDLPFQTDSLITSQ